MANMKFVFLQSMNSERDLYKKELSSMFMIKASNIDEDEKMKGT